MEGLFFFSFIYLFIVLVFFLIKKVYLFSKPENQINNVMLYVNYKFLIDDANILMDNNYQVTWVEHSEYDESIVHQLFRGLISSGVGFGAQRWLATLERQCECLAILMSSTIPSEEHTGTSHACPLLNSCKTVSYFQILTNFLSQQP